MDALNPRTAIRPPHRFTSLPFSLYNSFDSDLFVHCELASLQVSQSQLLLPAFCYPLVSSMASPAASCRG